MLSPLPTSVKTQGQRALYQTFYLSTPSAGKSLSMIGMTIQKWTSKPGVAVHACNPRAYEAEAGSLSLRSVWAAQWDPISKKKIKRDISIARFLGNPFIKASGRNLRQGPLDKS